MALALSAPTPKVQLSFYRDIATWRSELVQNVPSKYLHIITQAAYYQHQHCRLQLQERADSSHVLTQSMCGAAGLLQLEKLHLGWCTSIGDGDMEGLRALTRLSDLQLSRTKVSLNVVISTLNPMTPKTSADWPAACHLSRGLHCLSFAHICFQFVTWKRAVPV